MMDGVPISTALRGKVCEVEMSHPEISLAAIT